MAPVREELFSSERLEEHARSLAAAQTVTQKPPKGHPLTERLADNGTALLGVYRSTAKIIENGRSITPAAEWLIDNYHLVEQHIRQIRSDLRPGYYRQLPKLADGPFAGYPLVFGMAWAFVAHTDSRFDSEMLLHYVRAYQEVQPLTIGELWAVSITLRIVLIENLRRISEQIVHNHIARQEADDFADRLLGIGGRPAEPVPVVLAAHTDMTLSDPFAVQLVHRLRDQDPRVTPALSWLDDCLAARQTTADAVVSEVHRQQGAANVTVRNIITSLRLISDVDWKDLFEQLCLVDKILAAGSIFLEMDFSTRNLYRNAIEELARGSNRTELDVAHEAIAATQRATVSGATQPDARRHDPGYYLIAGGRHDFETILGFRRILRKWPAYLTRRFGLGGYVSAVAVIAAAFLALALFGLARAEVGPVALSLLAALGAVPAIDLAVALVNRAVTVGLHATILPALELRKGVPAELRTLVAVPMLLTTPEAIEAQIERLEIHHLASPEGDLHFALLSDWTDAATEHEAGDEALFMAALAGIERLNKRYGPAPGGARFLLFHRKRIWNPGEARWIGWERKRGKLHELNRLLRGATDTSFIGVGQKLPRAPIGITYVVTLDADTRLPRDTIHRLIGKMAHPLNRPRLDQATGRVGEGYAVLQPRVTPSMPAGQEGSRFQSVFSSLSGIDPYAAAVSDLYQEMFDEGSYTGKGIYEIDAFETALAGRIPDSTLLSHDLFEGIFARAGLASDIEVVEDFPTRYDVSALRLHRWARGDWQLLPWILGRRSAVPAIGRWKMLDNLRRTLSAPTAVLALLFGWTLSFEAAFVWTLFILSTIALPTLLPVIAAIPPRRPGITIASHMRALAGDFRHALAFVALNVTFLAHQAWLMGDAIGRTLVRLFITHRHLLEWVTAAQATSGRRLGLGGFYHRMDGALLVGAASIAVSLRGGHGTWLLAAPFAVLWLASPAVAHWVSAPPPALGRSPASERDARMLRLTARRTWRFFETFVTPADHMLPPDNYQEDPTPVVAHRTSPTNLGLYLLSVVSARDFGWIGTGDAIDRLEATLATMAGLERFRGHFYNWYDSSDLRPLEPKYVSSVDSGNLAGHLIALANACREWQGSSLDGARCRAGIADAIDITRAELAPLRDLPRWHQLDDSLAQLAAAMSAFGTDREDIPQCLSLLAGQAETVTDIARGLASEHGGQAGADLLFWAQASLDTIQSHRRDVARDAVAIAEAGARLATLENAARSMALAMEFDFLLNRERLLLAIGYLVPEGTLDPNCYDLLASEARLASFIAIAKGDVPARHWFRLGRAGTPVAHGAALISWSGSMFEYLMPSLIMRAPVGSLLEQTSRLVVGRQISYMASRRCPWGVSESAYNARDLDFTYQYSNFGIPGLGLKRGLGEDLVIAPYATALAAMVDPRASAANLARLAGAGGGGRYGFYEALDYTPIRVPEGANVAIVRAFMAHHQGMTIVAIADALMGSAMRARFHAEPIVQAAELLLQERMPRDVAIMRPWAAEVSSAAQGHAISSPAGRHYATAHQPTPATHLLSNGRYATMLTAAGSGYSRRGDLAITRWREDATCDDFGSYVFLRDVQSGEVWSAGLQPTGTEADAYNVVFNEDRAAFTRRDKTLTTTMEVLVSSEDDAEVRRISVTNAGSRVRELEITSYAELVLAPQAADIAHPAFSKLFVETEYLADVGAILATRRRRAPTEAEIWAAHLAVIDGEGAHGQAWGTLEVETDRARFLGRGQGIRTPLAMSDGRALSNTVGSVLDPIFSLRRRVRVAPGAIVSIAFWTIAASTRAALLDAVDKHRDTTAFGRASMLAWTQAQVQLHHLGITAGEASLFQRLAGHVIFANPALRPASDTIRQGSAAQSGLWAQGISGDLPIVLLRIGDTEHLDIARQLLHAHEYWRMKQLTVDLVILNERQYSYVQDLQSALETLVGMSRSRPRFEASGSPGHVFLLRGDMLPSETHRLLAAVARVVLVAQRGSLFDQLDRIAEAASIARAVLKPALMSARMSARTQMPPLTPVPKLEFFNGLGGFAAEGKEYVTRLGPGQSTPAPWINVIANPNFGFQVATEGSGYTWSINSRENQLTPWSNDPVTDRPGEAFYLQDDDSGALWCPTASPIRDAAASFVVHHGWGYSRFTHEAHEIAADLLQYVPVADPVKISRLVLHNRSGRTRHLSVTSYVEWVLGPSRSASHPFVITEIDPATGALFARNPWNSAFGARIAFLDLLGRQSDWTGDRRAFIGRNATLAMPLALANQRPLSNTVGAGLDPCGVLRAKIELPPGGRVEIVCLLGEAANADAARHLIAQYRAADLDAVLAEVTSSWDDVLGAVAVRTPDRAMDIMLNGWLLYQTLGCRLWARSAFYQSSGAYGFRDQLQDGMALVAARPMLTRAHLLRAAARQFVEGDVQHWWLPNSGQGVRTRISDDRAWLAYAVAHYVDATGDAGILDEQIAFLEGQALAPGTHDAFFHPTISDETATLFEHCARALDQSLALGRHGLPLIGTGDWNDGMNRVGEHGQGESVWLAWFLHAALTAFAPLAAARLETTRAETWHAHATALQTSLEREAWDGGWYRRGFFDDGTPLGAAASEECRIDSIAQSWAVLSGAAAPDRAARAMAALQRELIRPAEGLALLFAPPFDKTPIDPGYIKAYPPGIRENGGQYTHAALWSVMAFAALGEGDKAAGLFALLNPIHHALNLTDVHRYKLEPYVVAADICATAPHVGRGGWSWYTGSAGWMQRAGIESILGLHIQGAFAVS